MSRKRKSARGGMSTLHIIALVMVLAVGCLAISVFCTLADRLREKKKLIPCKANVKQLGLCMHVYAEENDGRYPDPNQWCDLLVEHFKPIKAMDKLFVCPGAKKAPSHYAMNPNADPNGPSNLVLLFDAKGGWNQYGGPEMLTFDNHRGKYCNIVFVDCHVEMVEPNEVSRLKWEVEEEGNGGAKAGNYRRPKGTKALRN